MTADVHALVQNTDDGDPGGALLVHDVVRTAREAEVAGFDLLDLPSALRSVSQKRHCSGQF